MLVEADGPLGRKSNYYSSSEDELGSVERRRSVKKEIIDEFLVRVDEDLTQRQFVGELIEEEQEDLIKEFCPFTPQLTNESRKIWNKKGIKPIHER